MGIGKGKRGRREGKGEEGKGEGGEKGRGGRVCLIGVGG